MTYYATGAGADTLPPLIDLDEFLRARGWSWPDFVACPAWLRADLMELDRLRRAAEGLRL
jgi:hypothetical protein